MTDRIIPQGYTHVPLDYDGDVWLESQVKAMGSEIESLRDKLVGAIGVLETRNREIERLDELLAEAYADADEVLRPYVKRIEEQLATSQVREAQLKAERDEAIKEVAKWAREAGAAQVREAKLLSELVTLSWSELGISEKDVRDAFPTDDSALKEAIKQGQREILTEAAEWFDSQDMGYARLLRRMAEEMK